MGWAAGRPPRPHPRPGRPGQGRSANGAHQEAQHHSAPGRRRDHAERGGASQGHQAVRLPQRAAGRFRSRFQHAHGASAGAAAPTAAGFSLSEAAGYALLPVVVLLLAHYLVVIALKLNTDYPLRAVAIVVPAVTGFLMLRQAERRQGAAWAIGTVMAVVAVIGMWTVQRLSTGTPILPTSAYDWRESFEYLATITCATVAGNLIGRMILTSPVRK